MRNLYQPFPWATEEFCKSCKINVSVRVLIWCIFILSKWLYPNLKHPFPVEPQRNV